MELSGNIAVGLLLTTFAGLSTGIGSSIAYFIKKPKVGYLSFSLGLSAGVMIYISFMRLLPDAFEALPNIQALTAFFAGIIFIGLIDMLVPEAENPHHYEGLDDTCVQPSKPLLRVGLFTALAIGIHNFPEGLATFSAALADIKIGLFIAIAIAIHNIPEGIAVSVPIFYATGSRKKAFLYSFLSGLSEPIGAVVGLLVLLPFLSEALLAFVSAAVAGIMVYISLDGLLPVAHRYGHGHTAIIGVVSGMAIMAISLLMI